MSPLHGAPGQVSLLASIYARTSSIYARNASVYARNASVYARAVRPESTHGLHYCCACSTQERVAGAEVKMGGAAGGGGGRDRGHSRLSSEEEGGAGERGAGGGKGVEAAEPLGRTKAATERYPGTGVPGYPDSPPPTSSSTTSPSPRNTYHSRVLPEFLPGYSRYSAFSKATSGASGSTSHWHCIGNGLSAPSSILKVPLHYQVMLPVLVDCTVIMTHRIFPVAKEEGQIDYNGEQL
eukprot:1095941-Rhodomonas_salina.1